MPLTPYTNFDELIVTGSWIDFNLKIFLFSTYHFLRMWPGMRRKEKNGIVKKKAVRGGRNWRECFIINPR